jgi:hypothetical protein
MPPDENAEPANPDLHAAAAGWALGALDPGDAAAFETHLQDCAECQTTVARFGELTRALRSAAPAVEPPADLGAKTLAAVQLAAMQARGEAAAAAHQPTIMLAPPDQENPALAGVRPALGEGREPEAGEPEGGAGRQASRKPAWWHWHWHWNLPVFSLAAALGAAAAAAIVIFAGIGQTAAPALVSGSGPAVRIPLKATLTARTFHDGGATGQAIARQAGESWTFRLQVHGLSVLPGNSVYECWWSPSGSGTGNAELISGGTFVVGKSGSTTLTMTTGVDPHQFKRMTITIEQPGSGQSSGRTILAGQSQF